MGAGVYRLAERRARDAAVRRPLPAAFAGRARLLRPAARRRAAQAGRAGPRQRRLWVLLLLLLVQRPAHPRASARPLRRRPDPRLPVLHLLGERKLEPALGRRQPRGAARAGARHRLGHEIHPRRHPAAQGPALYPGQRDAAAGAVPRRPVEDTGGDRGGLARGVRKGRAAGHSPLCGADLRHRRSAALRLRFSLRVPAARACGGPDHRRPAARIAQRFRRLGLRLRAGGASFADRGAAGLSALSRHLPGLGQHRPQAAPGADLPPRRSGAATNIGCAGWSPTPGRTWSATSASSSSTPGTSGPRARISNPI